MATANYTPVVTKIVLNEGGTAMATIANMSDEGALISEVTLEIPAADDQPCMHQRTGDTGVNPSADLIDAVAEARAQIETLLAAVVTTGKHAP